MNQPIKRKVKKRVESFCSINKTELTFVTLLFMVGTRMSFSVFYAKVTKTFERIVDYVIKLSVPMYSKKSLCLYCVCLSGVRNVSSERIL
jgi:hypothetical protein